MEEKQGRGERGERVGRVEGEIGEGREGRGGEIRYIKRIPEALLEEIGYRENITRNQHMIYNNKIRKLQRVSMI